MLKKKYKRCECDVDQSERGNKNTPREERGGGRGGGTYMSGLDCCQAADAGNAAAPPAMARGATNSMTRGWCHAVSACAWEGSERQSMSASEPRTSATRRSFVVEAWAQTELIA